MALQKLLVTDFSFGQVSSRFAGKLATEIRVKALEYISGFTLNPDGGVSRRRGTIYVRDGVGIAPSTNRLYDTNGVPSFTVFQDGTARWILYVQQTPLALRGFKFGTADTMSVADAFLEHGTKIGSTGTFYDPQTAGDHLHVWTATDAFHFALDTMTAITRSPQVDLAVVEQNRLISVDRSSGEINMSKTMDLFNFTDQGPASLFFQLAGTASATAAGSTVTGVGTQFEADFSVGDDLRIGEGAGSERRTIDAIASDTSLTVSLAFNSDHAGKDIYLVGTGQADPRPLFAIPDWADVEKAQWLVSRQSVYLGTDAAEYELYSAFPFFNREPGGFMIKQITQIGTEDAVYLGPGLAIQEADKALVIQYGGQGFDYQAMGLSNRIDNNRLITIEGVEFGTHRYLLALDVDGVLYCYLSSPASAVDGWCQIMSDVGWVWVHRNDAYVAVERDGAYSVEVLSLDALGHPGTRTKRQEAMFLANDATGDRGGYLIYNGTTLTGDELPPSASVEVYVINLAARHSRRVGVVATNASGELDLTDAQIRTLIGYTSGESYLYAHESGVHAEGEFRTLPLGGIIGSRNRVSKVVLQVFQSTGARVRVNDGPWEEHTVSEPESGTWEFRVSHTQEEEPRITVSTVGARPLNVYQVLVEVDVGG